MSDRDVPEEEPTAATAWWRQLGPGLITGAADDDPSGIATYSQGGAQFGYNMLWTLLFTYPLMVGIQLASAHIGRVTGEGLTENFQRLCPAWLVAGLVGLLVLANVVNIGADLNAMGSAAQMVLGGHAVWYAAGFGALSVLLQIRLPYDRYVTLLKWCTLSLLAYVGVLFSVHIDWPAALRGSLWPTITWSREFMTTVVAILGTTISPYLFFWQASQEVEEIRRIPADPALRDAPRQVQRQFRRLRIDTLAGMAFSNAVAFFIILTCAATLNAQGITQIETTAQAATALRPIAGPAAFTLFALGIIGTGMLAIPVLAGSAAYAVATVMRWNKGLDLPLRAASAFYAVLGGAVLAGAIIGVSGLDPIRALYWAAVLNAIISVPFMVAVMVIASSPRVMGALTIAAIWKVLGWAATAAMSVATVAMILSVLVH